MNKSRHFRVCKCCGFPLANEELAWLFRGKQRRVFEMIAAAGKAGISREAVVERLYAGERDGGPVYARGSVSVMIRDRIARRLEPHGLTITNGSGRGESPYRLVKIRARG